jgi:transposase
MPAAGSCPAPGMSVRETAEEIGIAKSVVHRMKQRIERPATEEGQDAGE